MARRDLRPAYAVRVLVLVTPSAERDPADVAECISELYRTHGSLDITALAEFDRERSART